jgi:phthalate 4,5-dioxygenase
MEGLHASDTMLTHEENETICRVGPDTAMGAAMRRYWLPACEASELPQPDCDPIHVELLGEHFVAFRDTQGHVGLLDERCCHRGASLLLGRVEDCGIRCLYHGWKFAVDGTVLDTPNVADPKFKNRIRARAYPVRESGGLIWTYLGPADQCPEFPEYPWMRLPQTHRINAVAFVNCNYVQIMEGLVDSSHLNILHDYGMRSAGGSTLSFAQMVGKMQADAAPHIEAEETEFGFHYAALRRAPGGDASKTLVRITSFIAPCFVVNPNGDLMFAVVPINDERTRFYHMWWDEQRPVGTEPLRSQQLTFVGLDAESLAATGMSAESSQDHRAMSRANRFLQNRQAMRETGHFTGIHSFTQEDAAVSISSGPIRDRTKEMLSTADIAIGRLYRVLLKCARQVQDGEEPLGRDAAVAVKVVGLASTVSSDTSWQSLVPEHRRNKAAVDVDA